MLNNFRTYNLAVSFYRMTGPIALQRHLKEQLDRAASSIVLNLAEGSGRRTPADQRRFFSIAFGSLRECQAILDLSPNEEASQCADNLGAHLYCLIKSVKGAAS